ncbi:hypothetical protein D3C77_639260 [compost metagenome]
MMRTKHLYYAALCCSLFQQLIEKAADKRIPSPCSVLNLDVKSSPFILLIRRKIKFRTFFSSSIDDDPDIALK